MLKGFKEFVLRGNVVDLATAVIIGTAFTAIVTTFTDKVIQPLINAIPGGSNPDVIKGLGFCVGECRLTNGSTENFKAINYIDLTAVITAGINFLITAAVVYFIIVLPYNKLSTILVGNITKDTEISLLTEIRNLMESDVVNKADAEQGHADVYHSNRATSPATIGGATGHGVIRSAGASTNISESGYPTGSQPAVRGGYPTGSQPTVRGGYPTGSQPAVRGGYPTGSQPAVRGGYPTGSQPTTEYTPAPTSYSPNKSNGYSGETNNPNDYTSEHPGRHSR